VKVKTAAEIKAEKLQKALKACKKDRVKRKRVLCEREARKRYGATVSKASARARRSSAKNATSNRRAGR
jgi:hypothetical protein